MATYHYEMTLRGNRFGYTSRMPAGDRQWDELLGWEAGRLWPRLAALELHPGEHDEGWRA